MRRLTHRPASIALPAPLLAASRRPARATPPAPLLAAVFLLLLSAVPRPAVAQAPPLGPLSFEEGAPLQRLGYTPMVEPADPVPPGRFRADLWLGYTNLFEEDSTAAHRVFLDTERLISAFTLRWGAARGLELGGRLTFETTWGGFLDRFMVEFHDALALGSRTRRYYPEGEHRLTVEDPGGLRVDVPRRSFALEDVRLFAKWGVVGGAGAGGAVSLRGVVRIPTAENAVGEESVDAALTALARTRWRGWHLHGMVGATTVRAAPGMEDFLEAWSLYFTAAVERPLNDGLSALLQYSESKPIWRDFGDSDLDNALANVILGVVGRAGEGWRWEVSMQEDWPPRGPSIDFQLHLALSRSW